MNCRLAEVSVFPKAPVAGVKRQRVVEARLHYDSKFPELLPRVRELFETWEVGDTRPLYILIDPETGEYITRFKGAPVQGEADKEEFIRFLDVIQ